MGRPKHPPITAVITPNPEDPKTEAELTPAQREDAERALAFVFRTLMAVGTKTTTDEAAA